MKKNENNQKCSAEQASPRCMIFAGTPQRREQNIQKTFSEITDELVRPIGQWQHQKPAQRSAFLLFSDKEVGEFHLTSFGNKRAKYPTATTLEGLVPALKRSPELLGWMKACVRCAERELKRKKSGR